MFVFYDPNDSNQVVAIYSLDTSSPWPGMTKIEVTDPAHESAIYGFGTSCRLQLDGNGDITGVVEFHPVAELRTSLIDRVAKEYDDWTIDGIPVTGLSWTGDGLIVLDRDVEKLGSIIGIAGFSLAKGDILSTDVVLGYYKFGDGLVKTNITGDQLQELCSTYLAIRNTRFVAHNNVKTAVAAGNMPAAADYVECNLDAADFNGLDLV
jgi:hypothetical protein